MRLIDHLRNVHQLKRPRLVARSKRDAWEKYSHQIWPFLRAEELTVVSMDGVATFYYETCKREYWDLGKREHFPDLTPPRPVMWFEYHFPERILSEIGETPNSYPNGRTGVLILKVDPKDAIGEGIPAHTQWILSCEVFIDYGLKPDEIQGPHGAIMIAIDSEGRIIGVPYLHTFTEEWDQEAHIAANLMINWLQPPLLALSWLPRDLPADRVFIEL